MLAKINFIAGAQKMSAKSLTIAVPETLLKQLRARARQAKRSVDSEVVNLLNDAISAEERLPPDIEAAIADVERLDEAGLRRAVVPLMKPKQAKRLEALNYKEQDEGLTPAEQEEREKLSHLYDKSMIVRATALAELHKLGVDVNELIAS